MQLIDLTELPLNWPIAQGRLERDQRDDFFPDPLRHRDVLTTGRRAPTLLSLREYCPGTADSLDVPKGNFTLRHSINISSIDRLVYQALVDHLAPACDAQLSERSYAFRLRGPDNHEMFIRNTEQFWRFEDATRAVLSQDASAIVVTLDVAQYFENLSLELLAKTLTEVTQARLGSPTHTVIDVLIRCLSAWTPYGRFGLPQNMWPSSFLGNVFLHSLDTKMTSLGYQYHRYMDDVRVIARDEAQARRAMRDLVVHLRGLELSVNGKKTQIVRPGSDAWLQLAAPPDQELADIEEIAGNGNLDTLAGVVPRLNKMLRESVDARSADRRLRFALGRLISLRRLGQIDVPEPEGYGRRVLESILWLPEQTPLICEYFQSGPTTQDTAQCVLHMLLDEPVCIYEWQNYHLWLLAAQKQLSDTGLVRRARDIVRRGWGAAEGAGAAVYLGAVGDDEDLALLASALQAGGGSAMLRRAMLIGLQRSLDQDRLFALATASPSQTVAVAARYLAKQAQPRFVASGRRPRLGQLRDHMPDIFS